MISTTPTYRPLWLGDNGRCMCRDCAGATAQASGMRHDLSGGPMERVTPEIVREFQEALGYPLCCETCGALARTVEVAR